ncbi:GDP-fucose synthetase [Candidatus Woesearchaeota archaeon]|nr:GDP-fucose synthetase [Candidatus Woesearchaeota archaeon]
MFWDDKNVLVTGGHGFLGKQLIDLLKEKNPKKLFVPSHEELDLTKLENCKKAVEGMDIVIHLAGKVGGIGFNQGKPAEVFYDNLVMGVQLMEEARKANVKKFVALATVCSYPKITPAPFKEEDLWNGYPEETNAPYGLAKKMLIVQAQAYRQQYDYSAISLLPANLYGPRDNFDLNSSHAIPAIIRKVLEAKKKGENKITLWGDGSATRDFLYVKDAANGILLATEKYDKPDPVNIGTGREISIKELAELICKLCDFNGTIEWDTSKPNGQMKRHLNIEKAKAEFGFQPEVPLEEGLKNTIDWYRNQSGI